MGYIGEGINQTATSVETAKDEFFGTYYGQISSDPSVDPNGDAITDGDLFYNTSEEALKIRVNGEWLSLRTATTGYQQFTATSGQTTFDVAGSYSPGFVFVTLNGVVLASGDYDDSSGTEIVLTDGAADGDILGVYLFDTFSVADTVSASAGGTFSSPVAFPDGSESLPSITNDQDTNTGIFFPADNTIAFTEGGSEAARINSSGNLLVGTTNSFPGSGNTDEGFSVVGGRIFASDSSPSYFNRNGNDGNIINFRKDGSTVGSIGVKGPSPYFSWPDAQTGIRFLRYSTTNGIVSPCDANGDVRDNALDLGASFARWNDVYVGGGIYLGGTGSANYLDDYEEGTWTPTAKDSSNNQISLSGVEAFYTKIGRAVMLVAGFNVGDLSGANTSADFIIEGLPFSVGNVPQDRFHMGSVLLLGANYDTSQSGTTHIAPVTRGLRTQIRFQQLGPSNSSGAKMEIMDLNNGSIFNGLSITYFTDS